MWDALGTLDDHIIAHQALKGSTAAGILDLAADYAWTGQHSFTNTSDPLIRLARDGSDFVDVVFDVYTGSYFPVLKSSQPNWPGAPTAIETIFEIRTSSDSPMLRIDNFGILQISVQGLMAQVLTTQSDAVVAANWTQSGAYTVTGSQTIDPSTGTFATNSVAEAGTDVGVSVDNLLIYDSDLFSNSDVDRAFLFESNRDDSVGSPYAFRFKRNGTASGGHTEWVNSANTQLADLSNTGVLSAANGDVSLHPVVTDNRLLTAGVGINTLGDLSADRTVGVDTNYNFTGANQWTAPHDFNSTVNLNGTTTVPEATVTAHEGALDHSAITNLNWAAAGHTIDGNIVMADNSLTGIDTLTFTDVNGTIAGIENQNLLDKSATETVSGTYSFTNDVTVTAGGIFTGGATGGGLYSNDLRGEVTGAAGSSQYRGAGLVGELSHDSGTPNMIGLDATVLSDGGSGTAVATLTGGQFLCGYGRTGTTTCTNVRGGVFRAYTYGSGTATISNMIGGQFEITVANAAHTISLWTYNLSITTPSIGASAIVRRHVGLNIADLGAPGTWFNAAVYVAAQASNSSAAAGNIWCGGGDWDDGHLQLENGHIWNDPTNNLLRTKGAAPTSSTDGLPITTFSHGEIYVQDNATTMSVSSSGWTQVVIFANNGSSSLTTPDHTNDHITIGETGTYFIAASLAVENGAGASHNIEVSVFRNNGATELPNVHAHRTLAAGTDKGSVSLNGIAALTAADTIEVWILSDRGVASAITVSDITLSLVRIG